MLFSIEDLPPYGSGLHSITYTRGSPSGVMFSEPIEIERKNISELVETLVFTHTDLSLFKEANRIRKILSEYDVFRSLDIKIPDNNSEIVNTGKNILLSYYGIIWLPVISIEQNELRLRIE